MTGTASLFGLQLPEWSPDAASLAFAAYGNNKVTSLRIYKVPSKGGKVVQLTDTMQNAIVSGWRR